MLRVRDYAPRTMAYQTAAAAVAVGHYQCQAAATRERGARYGTAMRSRYRANFADNSSGLSDMRTPLHGVNATTEIKSGIIKKKSKKSGADDKTAQRHYRGARMHYHVFVFFSIIC